MVNISVFFTLITLAVAQEYREKFENLSTDERHNFTDVNLNDFFDRRLPFIRRLLVKKGLDPMVLPDAMFPLSRKPLLKGQVHLQKGRLDDLAMIRRAGDVNFRYNNDALEVDLNLGWPRLHVNYNYTLTYIFGTREGEFRGYLNNPKIMIQGSIDLETYQLKFRIFKFIDTGNFSLKLEGHLADYLINAVTNVVTKFGKERLLRQVEQQITQGIKGKVDGINKSIPDVFL